MKLTFDVPEKMVEKIAEDIKAALKGCKIERVWPQKGDDYYFIFSDGQIACNRYDDFHTDRKKLEIGNMFKTEEEAMFKREQLRVLHELEQLADDDQPWDKDGSYSHVCIQYSRPHDKCRPTANFRYAAYSPFFFKSVESCQAAIDKIGEDRLKKYYFCVPEE